MDLAWCSEAEAREFWNALDAGSRTSHGFSRRPFAEPICSLDDLGRAVACMAADRTIHVAAPLQVFVEDSRQPSYESEVLRNPPAPGEHFEEWIARVFGSRRFSLFVNSVERWSPKLAARVAHLTRPLYSSHPAVDLSVEIGFLVRNDGYTPFGVHCDGEDMTIVHLQLGPSFKRLWMWQPERFVELTGSTLPYHRPDEILEGADEIRLSSGDAALFPSRLYHIGHCSGLSAALVLLLRWHSKAAVTQEAVLADLDEGSLDRDDITLSKWIAEATRLLVLSRESNGGLRAKPMRMSVADEGLLGKVVRRVNPFPILVLPDGATMKVFVRGSQITLPNDPTIRELVNEINTGEAIPVSAVVEKYGHRLALDAVMFLISLLAQHQAIYVMQSSEALKVQSEVDA